MTTGTFQDVGADYHIELSPGNGVEHQFFVAGQRVSPVDFARAQVARLAEVEAERECLARELERKDRVIAAADLLASAVMRMRLSSIGVSLEVHEAFKGYRAALAPEKETP